MSKIVWSQEETHDLATAAAPLVAKGMSPLDAVRQVQRGVLKPYRIRDLDSNTDIKKVLPLLDAKVKALGIAGTTRAVQDALARPVAITQGNGAPGDLPDWMKAQIEVEAEREAERLRQQYTEALSQRIREKLQGSVRVEPPNTVVPPVPQPAPAPVATPQATMLDCRTCKASRPHVDGKCTACGTKYKVPDLQPEGGRKPKVVVIGCWPNVRADVNAEFGEVFDMRFFDADPRERTTIQNHCQTADRVFALRKATAGLFGNFLHTCAKDKLDVVDGSVSQLKEHLTRYYVKRSK